MLLLQRLQEVVVNFENNLQMARQDLAEHLNRPGFQRFAHQRMVGVGEDLAGHFKRLVPVELMLVNQQAHQFRDRQHRVGVVEVNGDFVRQVAVGLMQLEVAMQNILHRRRDQEVLLAQTQLAPGVSGVIGVEHAGDVLGVVLILHRREVVALVEFTEVNRATGLRVPQTQRIGRVCVIAGDNLVVGHREDLFGFNPAALSPLLLNAPAKPHFVARVVAFELPRVAILQPVIGGLFLTPLDDVLFKHAVIIANAVAASRQPEGRQRIEEAGCQPPEAAVT